MGINLVCKREPGAKKTLRFPSHPLGSHHLAKMSQGLR